MANSTDKFGTGFEAGTKSGIVSQASTASLVTIQSSGAFTGDHFLEIATDGAVTTNYAGIDVPADVTDEVYITVNHFVAGTNKGVRIGVELDDGTRVYLQKDTGSGNTNLDAYRNGTLLASGTANISAVAFDRIEIRIKIANSGGRVVSTISGSSDVNFTGDTQPSASTQISYVYAELFGVNNDNIDVDDWTIYTSSAPGDIRYQLLTPNADTATVDWTPVNGGDNYVEINEDPPDTADYVSATSSSLTDLYDMSTYSVGKQVVLVGQYVHAAYITTASSLQMIIKSGGTTDTDSAQNLTTSAANYNRILDQDPNTMSSWTVAALNGVIIGHTATVGASGTVRVYSNVLEIGYDQDVTAGTFTGIRPGNHQIDTTDGTKLYGTKWDAGTIYLTVATEATMAQTSQLSFGSVTSIQWDDVTYFIRCFAPPFGTANYVYVYGRWDLSGDQYIRLSTDGGLNFNADIGPSAMSGSDYISAFFATDENTLYAFRAGTTKALYRSQDAGASWSTLSTLPFNAAAATLGSDGRLAIANADSGASQIAIAEGPLFATWATQTATGLPTNAKGNIVWL